jgi:hypothetical protein
MRVVFTTGFLLRNNIDGNNYYRNDFRTICICNEFLKNKRTEWLRYCSHMCTCHCASISKNKSTSNNGALFQMN